MVDLFDRVNVHNAKRVLANPQMLIGEANRLGVIINRHWHARSTATTPATVMDRDWDVLIILDACRYDVFAAECSVDGELSAATSPGSESTEYMAAVFDDRHHDTVYLTANPNAAALDAETFHAIHPLYDTAWDDTLGTVPPERVATALRDADQDYPNKRLIAHFMQPHAPYIGSTTVPHTHATSPDAEDRTIWANLRYGLKDVSLNELRAAYRANLRRVLDVVADVSDAVTGKVVITADHGELLGDRLRPIPVRGYGHPPGLRVPELTEVPWFECPHDERRTVEATPPVERVDTDLADDALDERLAALGYR